MAQTSPELFCVASSPTAPSASRSLDPGATWAAVGGGRDAGAVIDHDSLAHLPARHHGTDCHGAGDQTPGHETRGGEQSGAQTVPHGQVALVDMLTTGALSGVPPVEPE